MKAKIKTTIECWSLETKADNSPVFLPRAFECKYETKSLFSFSDLGSDFGNRHGGDWKRRPRCVARLQEPLQSEELSASLGRQCDERDVK